MSCKHSWLGVPKRGKQSRSALNGRAGPAMPLLTPQASLPKGRKGRNQPNPSKAGRKESEGTHHTERTNKQATPNQSTNQENQASKRKRKESDGGGRLEVLVCVFCVCFGFYVACAHASCGVSITVLPEQSDSYSAMPYLGFQSIST